MSQTTSQTCAYEYTVRRGDSFYLIAHRLGVPLKDLLEANSDINPARLMVGDVLCIPGAAAETPDTNITAPTTPDASDTTTNDALDTPAADMNAPATPGGETPDISFCPEIDRYTVLQGETAADVQLKKDVNRHTLETANPDVNLDALQAGQVLCVPENQACPPGNTYTLDKDETMETTALLLNVSLSALGWAIPEEYTDIFADLVIVGAVLLVSCKYIKEAFTKFNAILQAKGEDEQ